jgi:ABC-type cobalt transport system substrate-binding protein
MTGGESAAEAYVTALDPALLAEPFFAFVIDQGVSEVGSLLTGVFANMGITIVIDIQTNGEDSSVLQAATALQFANSSGNQNAINQSTQKLVQAWGSLIHWDGTPSAST